MKGRGVDGASSTSAVTGERRGTSREPARVYLVVCVTPLRVNEVSEEMSRSDREHAEGFREHRHEVGTGDGSYCFPEEG